MRLTRSRSKARNSATSSLHEEKERDGKPCETTKTHLENSSSTLIISPSSQTTNNTPLNSSSCSSSTTVKVTTSTEQTSTEKNTTEKSSKTNEKSATTEPHSPFQKKKYYRAPKPDPNIIPRRKNMSILEKIIYSIRSLKDGPKGSTRQAIRKFLKSEFDLDDPKRLQNAFKRGMKQGLLKQIGSQQYFIVAVDEYVPQLSSGSSTSVCAEETTQTVKKKSKDKGKKAYKMVMNATVYTEDIMIGQGNLSTRNGDIVTIQYVGTLDDGTEFDTVRSFTFLLGTGEVIQGLERGLLGMKIGGKRKIIVPESLGYRHKGLPPIIPPYATLRFEITLRDVQRI